MNEDYLQHHGVKGMRWGVIRTTRERHGLKQQMREANKEAKNKLYKWHMDETVRQVDRSKRAKQRYKDKKASLKSSRQSGKITPYSYRKQKSNAKAKLKAINKDVDNKLYELGGKNDKGLQRYKAEKKQNKLNYIKKAYDPKQITLGRKILDLQGGPIALAKGYKYATAGDPKASKKRRLGYAYVLGSFAGDVIR